MSNSISKLKNNKFLLSLPIPKKKFIWSMLQFPLFSSALNERGWFKSVWKEYGVDAKGNPLPWITYPIISFLEPRLEKNMSVFEYGSGSSTAWWSKFVDTVTSIEYDEKWFHRVKKSAPENAEIKFVKLGDNYPKAISQEKKKFDVVLVAGRIRVECAANSVKYLRKGGVIIWDNTDRDRYNSGTSKLTDIGFKRLDFVGMVPSSNKISQTSIFYKNENCLGI